MTENSEIMNGLLGKVFTVLAAKDDITQNPKSDIFVSYAAPGIPMSIDDFAFGNLETAQEVSRQAFFSNLVNTIPSMTGFWSSTGKMIWGVYDTVLRDIRTSRSIWTSTDNDNLQKAQKYLFNEQKLTDPYDKKVRTVIEATPYVKSYSKYLSDYNNALLKYNSMAISASEKDAPPELVKEFNRNGPILRREVENAFAQWSAEGNKGSVEKARAVISMLTGRGTEQHYAQLKSRLDLSSREDVRLGNYYPTYYFPENALEGNSWTKVNYTTNEVHTYSEGRKTSFGGGVSKKWMFGLFSVGASASYSEESSHYTCNTEGLNASFEVLQLPILRPWFDSSVFEARNWKWSDNRQDLISDGKTPPTGLMPAFASSILVSRNLKIKMDMSKEENRSFANKASGSASAGWGFFSLKGNYNRETSTATHDFKSTSTGIECDGMQIIGFICNKLPLSPNPDPKLTW